MSYSIEGGQGPVSNPIVNRPESVSDDIWNSHRRFVEQFMSSGVSGITIETTPVSSAAADRMGGKPVIETDGI